MRVPEEERGIVAQFFAMLADKSWSPASSADGTDVFKLPGERIHRIMGVTRTEATPEQVLTFFSDPHNFDEHFKILDDMFKAGSVVKIGGAQLALEEIDDEDARPSSSSFSTHMRGPSGKPSGNTDRLDDGNVFSKLKRSPFGAKLDLAFSKAKTKTASGVKKLKNENESPLAQLDVLPNSTTEATRDALAYESHADAQYSLNAPGTPFDETHPDFGSIMDLQTTELDGKFKDRHGHALLHGTFKLPSIVPDRDFIWDQVALRLPTGSVLIAGKSISEFQEDENVAVTKGHVRGAVLTSGYYIQAETEDEGGGSRIAFVVQADPKGSLPAWVVNFVAPKQAHNVTRLRKYLDGN